METSNYQLTPKAGTFAKAIELLEKFTLDLEAAYDAGFGTFSGFYNDTENPDRATEQKALEGVLAPVRNYFKERLTEEITEKVYRA